MSAVEMMIRRNKIEALRQVKHTLELAWADLAEEASRWKQKNQNRNQ
ncbi:MAG: hypothetical protein F6K36_26115 [Symploca sp. SIO3C6]|uniref:Uncharacterized protein n=1 Tax=Symploca sp. SIO1C4 TaxID=2607765 RepID=A0A6B3NN16_9CYAN|nr:hypothetical protein [Symploca sp. SIO3C6]NER31624.1 hypothetical protein [Symploca sp. SIO1C4]